ncbi:MAG: hypothetical protein LQ347_003060 [Umbilicaria vellea]|nr:MAG: hypothetical protein LQ347_003060 [Umbilicaria vellea]
MAVFTACDMHWGDGHGWHTNPAQHGDKLASDEDLTLQEGVAGTTNLNKGNGRVENWEFEQNGESEKANIDDLPKVDLSGRASDQKNVGAVSPQADPVKIDERIYGTRSRAMGLANTGVAFTFLLRRG